MKGELMKNHVHHHHKGSGGGFYSFLGSVAGAGLLVGLFGGGWTLFLAPLGIGAAVAGLGALLDDGKTVTHHHYRHR
jgi:hypothetical protein